MPTWSPSTYLQFAATGLTVNVLGQSLTGDVTVVKDTTGTTVQVRNATLNLGGGLVAVTAASADLTVTAEGVFGVVTGTVGVTVPGVAFTGTATITAEVNTTTTRPLPRWHVDGTGCVPPSRPPVCWLSRAASGCSPARRRRSHWKRSSPPALRRTSLWINCRNSNGSATARRRGCPSR